MKFVTSVIEKYNLFLQYHQVYDYKFFECGIKEQINQITSKQLSKSMQAMEIVALAGNFILNDIIQNITNLRTQVLIFTKKSRNLLISRSFNNS
jgi:hypothetical protein